MPSTLCTRLPDADPSGWAERYLFRSSLRSDWCHEGDLADMCAAFEADGHPYTLQLRPATPEPEGYDWADECRSAASRNPSL